MNLTTEPKLGLSYNHLTLLIGALELVLCALLEDLGFGDLVAQKALKKKKKREERREKREEREEARECWRRGR